MDGLKNESPELNCLLQVMDDQDDLREEGVYLYHVDDIDGLLDEYEVYDCFMKQNFLQIHSAHSEDNFLSVIMMSMKAK